MAQSTAKLFVAVYNEFGEGGFTFSVDCARLLMDLLGFAQTPQKPVSVGIHYPSFFLIDLVPVLSCMLCNDIDSCVIFLLTALTSALQAVATS